MNTLCEVLPTFARDTEARLVYIPETGWLQQRRPDGAIHRAAKNYRVTSPEQIGEQLEAKGFRVERCLSLFSQGRFEPGADRRNSPWKYGLEVAFPGPTMQSLDPDGDASDYQLRARILLANDGREALKIGLGALRVACTNQFTGCLMSIRHTDPEIDGFLADPAGWLNDARSHAEAAVKNLACLRGLPAGGEFFEAVQASPRLNRTFRREAHKYFHEERRRELDRPTFWGLAQALTGTRSPRLVRASMHLLQASPEALGRGDCPEYFKVLVKASPKQATVGGPLN